MFPTMLRHDTCSHNTNTHDTDCDTHCDTDSYLEASHDRVDHHTGRARPGTVWCVAVADRCNGSTATCWDVATFATFATICNCSFKLNWFEWTYVRKTLTTHSQGTFAMRSCSPSVFLEQASSSKQFPMSWAGLSCLAGCNRLGGPWLLHVIPGNWPDMALSLPVISPKMDNLVLDLGVCDVSLETEHVMLLWCSLMLFSAFLFGAEQAKSWKLPLRLTGSCFFCVCVCVCACVCAPHKIKQQNSERIFMVHLKTLTVLEPAEKGHSASAVVSAKIAGNSSPN